MKCEYCGTELNPNDEKCPGCFAKIDKTKSETFTEEKTTPSVIEDNNNVISQNNNTNLNNELLNNQTKIKEDFKKENKKNNGLIIILLAIIIGLVVFGIFFFIIDDDTKKNNNSDSFDSSKYELSNETVSIGNYKFSIPKGWTHRTHNNYEYIQNNECMIVPTEYAINYQAIVNNKQYFIDSLDKQGYNIESYTTKKIDGKDYIIAVGSMNNTSYGFMFSDLDSETTAFVTIISNSAGEFKEEWFNYGSLIVKSAKKI